MSEYKSFFHSDGIGNLEFPIPHLVNELNFPASGGKGAYPSTIKSCYDFHPATKEIRYGHISASHDALAFLLLGLYSLPSDVKSFSSLLGTAKQLIVLLKQETVKLTIDILNKKVGHVLNYRLKDFFRIR